MTLQSIVKGTRTYAGLFETSDRGLLEVRGTDRVRWLDGMISNDVEALEERGSGAGCYATLLTNRGAIIADLHVGLLDEAFFLESRASEIGRVRETLDRFIIADDVTLVDRTADFSVLGLEGPASERLLAAVLEGGSPPSLEQWCVGTIGDHPVLVAAFGFSGERAFQLRCAPDAKSALVSALDAAADEGALVHGNAEALEVLRVEAGIPALGAELDEEVLPPEARLDHAISTSKGCYVGQEIVARLRARGQVNQLLVGLALPAESAAVVGAELSAGGREIGEITSLVESPSEGKIALGYVRREHAEPGTEVELAEGRARVVALPFVTLSRAEPV